MVERLRLDRVETPEFLDTIYALLASSHRRNVLHYLMTHRKPVSVHRLATEVAAIEHDVAPEDVTDDQYDDEFLSLKHTHLPMLDDTGVITWDRDAERIALTPLLDHLSVTVPSSGGIFGVSVTARPETS